ncbi:DUF6350 family protein [Puerhibacterium sp. TATVAM-FAB25]|uniref:cell division protein PerM n=1 Tax=Puerhibacterium sp. TATVAM-FAB25 TaxID=3093699 RepID=UPI00397B137D
MSTTRSTPRSASRPPRTVEAAMGGPVLGSRVADTMSGVWAVVQSVVLSFLLVLLLTVVAMLGAPGTGDVPWGVATGTAGGVWLLGHGVPVTVGGTTVTLVPLGVGALAVFCTYVCAKRSMIPVAPAVLAGTALYAATTTAVAAAGGVRGGALLTAALGGVVVAGVGLGTGALAQPEAPRVGEVTEVLFGWVPPVARLGVRAGALATALLLGAAALVTTLWVLAGRATAGDVLAGLAPGWIGGVVLGVAQLALLPNLVLWALAWLAGPGFAVGEGTAFTVRDVVDGPLPAFPLLGALPGPSWTGGASLAAPAAVVLCGVVAGWFAWRRLEPTLVRWSDVAWVAGATAVTAGVAVALLQRWAGGAVGAGRLAEIGAHPLLVAGVVAGEVLAGVGGVLAVAHSGLLTGRGGERGRG